MCEKYKSRKKLKCWSFDYGHLSWHLLKSSNVHQVEVCVMGFHSTTAKKLLWQHMNTVLTLMNNMKV